MGRITKFSAEQIKTIVEVTMDVGAAAASRHLALVGIAVSPGGCYFWWRKANPNAPKQNIKRGRKPKALVA